MEDQELSKSSIKILTDPQQGDGDFGKKSPASILTRLHAGYFRISLSFGGHVLLWKNLSEHVYESQAIHVIFRIHTLPSVAFLQLCSLSLCILILLSVLYILKCIFLHQSGESRVPAPCWCQLSFHSMDFMSCFAPDSAILTSQISVIGNLVGAWTAARMGWKESDVCLFTLGLAHYLVVFITLYQPLSAANRFPAMLRPVFFLFVAAPSMESLAWSSISGSFDMPCKMLSYLSLFLLSSLAS
ncbi:unnamed protein product [Fraxinus pennsylvanica]|uniref:Uncharacterized protein n=1 Tax=Fraxinus pennsylvanica TaxID=56036 RepID=A0AAD2EC57_9LAMI|nr:unnamed protein product [Fraxinus pennsylvanica]